jgi:pimeloyl-ACP methyl ester carboxylesterase
VNEQFATVGDLTICYETFGDPADETVLLIMGLASQMIHWDERFCRLLVDRGFHVVRFDNRDSGRSSRVNGRPPGLKDMVLRNPKAATYTLSDMAADAVGVLDHLGIARAHVVGASMGGMIAQTVAIEHPDRVLSLVSIMSNTGGRFTGQPAFTILPVFLRRPPRDREGYVDHVVTLFGKIGSPGFQHDEARLRRHAELAYDRGVSAAGNGRQIAAILADRDRGKRLEAVRVPTLVVHGTKDPLVHVSGGRATAKAVPGAQLMLIDGMGHDLPQDAWERIADGIAENARRASSSEEPDAASAVR